MAIKAVYIDPRKPAQTFDGGAVDLHLSEDGAVTGASVDGKSVDVAGLRQIISDSRNYDFPVTVHWADGKAEGPFHGVQHVDIRVNYGMNLVDLLQFERLQRIWYSQKAPAGAV